MGLKLLLAQGFLDFYFQKIIRINKIIFWQGKAFMVTTVYSKDILMNFIIFSAFLLLKTSPSEELLVLILMGTSI